MTEEILTKANFLREDIQLLELREKQVHDFFKECKKGKHKENYASSFLDDMLNVIKELKNIKKEQFKNL